MLAVDEYIRGEVDAAKAEFMRLEAELAYLHSVKSRSTVVTADVAPPKKEPRKQDRQQPPPQDRQQENSGGNSNKEKPTAAPSPSSMALPFLPPPAPASSSSSTPHDVGNQAASLTSSSNIPFLP